jgi:hypothetical protein
MPRPDNEEKQGREGGDAMKESPCCPGFRMHTWEQEDSPEERAGTRVASQLRQWPIQLHLVSSVAPYYQGTDVLLAADCAAFAMGNFHDDFLKGKALAIACPNLDGGQDVYREKIQAWFNDAMIKSLTVLVMEVPCCQGLLGLASRAFQESERKVPVRIVLAGLSGQVLREDLLEA